MKIKAFVAVAISLAAVSTACAKSLTVYFGTYTRGDSSKGIYRSTLDLDSGKLSEPGFTSPIAPFISPNIFALASGVSA